MARAAAESLLGADAAAMSMLEAEEAVDVFLDHQGRETPSGIGQRNRARRRARARREQVNDLDNWVEAVDPQSGEAYWYNRLTRVSAWERPTQRADGGGRTDQLVRPTKTEYEGFRGFPGVKPVKPPRDRNAVGGCVGWLVTISAAALIASGLAAVLYMVWMLNFLPRQLPPPGAMLVGAMTALLQIALVKCGIRSWVAAAFVIVGAWCVPSQSLHRCDVIPFCLLAFAELRLRAPHNYWLLQEHVRYSWRARRRYPSVYEYTCVKVSISRLNAESFQLSLSEFLPDGCRQSMHRPKM
eukprot:SAG22_NODE_1664_length_3864_cov_1.637716_4_plen_298_part_00